MRTIMFLSLVRRKQNENQKGIIITNAYGIADSPQLCR